MMKRRYAVLIYREANPADNDYRFYAVVPSLPGCITGGDSYDEVMENVREAIAVYVDGMEEIPVDFELEPPHLAIVDVDVSVPASVGG